MKVVIIEDEPLAAKKLIRLLNEVAPDILVESILESVEKAAGYLSTHTSPDLIFMDIQLEDGLCFEIFDTVSLTAPVIFTTAYDEYTLKAFKVNSIDYLLKPIDPDELKLAIEKYRLIHEAPKMQGMHALMNQFLPAPRQRMLIKIGEHFKPLEIAAVNCFYILDRCCFAHTREGKNYPVDYSLDKIEDMLDKKLFFRISRHMIVNINAVKDILAYSSNRLKLTLDHWNEKQVVLVSRERVSDFKKWIDR